MGEIFKTREIIYLKNYIKDNPERLLDAIFNFLEVSKQRDYSRYPVRRVIQPSMVEKRISDDKSTRFYEAVPKTLRQDLRQLFQPMVRELRQRFPNEVGRWGYG